MPQPTDCVLVVLHVSLSNVLREIDNVNIENIVVAIAVGVIVLREVRQVEDLHK
jgi:hypothetical protein